MRIESSLIAAREFCFDTLANFSRWRRLVAILSRLCPATWRSTAGSAFDGATPPEQWRILWIWRNVTPTASAKLVMGMSAELSPSGRSSSASLPTVHGSGGLPGTASSIGSLRTARRGTRSKKSFQAPHRSPDIPGASRTIAVAAPSTTTHAWGSVVVADGGNVLAAGQCDHRADAPVAEAGSWGGPG